MRDGSFLPERTRPYVSDSTASSSIAFIFSRLSTTSFIAFISRSIMYSQIYSPVSIEETRQSKRAVYLPKRSPTPDAVR